MVEQTDVRGVATIRWMGRRIGATVAASVGLLVLAVAAERRGNVPFPLIDLLIGWALLLCGLAGASRRVTRGGGVLLLAAGGTWFVATAELWAAATEQLTYVHRAFVVHAALAVSGSTRRALRTAVAAVAYVASIDAERALSTPWLVTVAGTATAVLVFDASWTRRAWPFAAAAVGGITVWTATVAWLRPHDLLGPAQRSALYGLGLVMASVAVAARPAFVRARGPATGDIVRDGGTGDVQVGFRDDPGEPFSDASGALIDVPRSPRALIVPSPSGGETAIIHPGAADARGAIRDGLVDAAMLLRAHRDAVVTQRVLARDIAESERRIRLADEIASAEVAFDLQRGVVAVLERAGSRLDGDTGAAASQARDALGAIAAELRTIADGLTPPDLERGFPAAVAALAERTTVPVHVAVDPAPLDPQVATALYFVVAEALTNAVRHARPTTIDIRFVVDATAMRLVVADDGAGGAHVADGGGLNGLRQRLATLGGTLWVDGRAEGGTTLTAHLPPAAISPLG